MTRAKPRRFPGHSFANCRQRIQRNNGVVAVACHAIAMQRRVLAATIRSPIAIYTFATCSQLRAPSPPLDGLAVASSRPSARPDHAAFCFAELDALLE